MFKVLIGTIPHFLISYCVGGALSVCYLQGASWMIQTQVIGL